MRSSSYARDAPAHRGHAAAARFDDLRCGGKMRASATRQSSDAAATLEVEVRACLGGPAGRASPLGGPRTSVDRRPVRCAGGRHVSNRDVTAAALDEPEGRNESFFRELNERLLGANGAQHYIQFACECWNRECAAPVVLTPEEYEAVRRFPTHFLVAPAHVDSTIERIVEQNDAS